MSTGFRAVVGGICLLVVVLALSVGEVDAQTPATVRPLTHSKLVLPNGLVALFNEDHATPTIGAVVWYRFGAKDEVEGRQGFAHLCEHMMFEGSPNVRPGQFESIMRSAGATSSRMAETNEDRTYYFQTVPSNQLETWLWLESDRMAAPFVAVDSTRLPEERKVVKLERQQSRENITFGFSNTLTLGALYSGPFPYRDPAASMVDVDSASFTGMRQFCEPYYVPNNAIIALSGDFNTEQAKALVQKYFGSIKRGAEPKRPDIRATAMSTDRRMVLEDSRSTSVTLRLAWAGAGFGHDDRLALNALASVMQGNQSSGLTKTLVYDRRMATSVSVNHFDLEKGGVFQIEVTPSGATPLGAIEDLVDSVLKATRETPPAASALERYKNKNALVAITSLQGRVVRADTLAMGQAFANDPVAYAAQVNRTNRLTPADVQRAAAKYLTPGRVVMSMIPAGKLDLVSKPELKFENVSAVVPKAFDL